MRDARGGARWVRALGVLGVVVGLALVPAAGADADPALTKERLYALVRERPYGTPVALDVPGEHVFPDRVTDSGYVLGVSVVGTDWRYFRWYRGSAELFRDRNGREQTVVDLNERGQVLGFEGWDDEGYQRAFLWQPDGSVVDLSAVARWRQVAAIDDRGVVVGSVDDFQPATWRDGTLTRYPSPGGWVLMPNSGDTVNDRGDFLGTATRDGVRRGYVWRDGVPHELPAEAGAEVEVERINERGDVVGHVDSGTTRGLVLWERGLRLRVIDEGDRYRMAVSDLNERGVVVGNAGRSHLRGPLRFDHRGVLTPLPGLGAKGEEVRAVHDLNVAVGSALRPGDEYPHAVAWVHTVPVPLGERLDGRQAIGGWASDVNAQGQVVGVLRFADRGAVGVVWDLRRR